jgi:hypothetical protein
VVELGEAIVEGAHALAGVKEENNILITLFFEFTADELPAFGGGFPIDLREDIAFLVFAELMELFADADDVFANDAHLALAMFHGEEGEADDGLVVGIDFHFVGGTGEGGASPEAEGRVAEEVGGGEGEAPPFHELDGINEGGVSAGGDVAAPREFMAFGILGHAIEDGNGGAEFSGVSEGQGDILEHAEGEAAGRSPLGDGDFQEAERDGIAEAAGAEEGAADDPEGEQLRPDGGEESEACPRDDESE